MVPKEYADVFWGGEKPALELGSQPLSSPAALLLFSALLEAPVQGKEEIPHSQAWPLCLGFQAPWGPGTSLHPQPG